jgi:hypothetical protein
MWETEEQRRELLREVLAEARRPIPPKPTAVGGASQPRGDRLTRVTDVRRP